jgi:hypothetical protein
MARLFNGAKSHWWQHRRNMCSKSPGALQSPQRHGIGRDSWMRLSQTGITGISLIRTSGVICSDNCINARHFVVGSVAVCGVRCEREKIRDLAFRVGCFAMSGLSQMQLSLHKLLNGYTGYLSSNGVNFQRNVRENEEKRIDINQRVFLEDDPSKINTIAQESNESD